MNIAPKRLKGAKLVTVTTLVGAEGFTAIEAKNKAAAEDAAKLVKAQAAKSVKKAATPGKKSAASPAAFRKTKPKATPVKSPKAIPKKAAVEPLSPRSRNTPRRASAAKKIKYAESESDDFEDDSEFEADTAVEESEDDFSGIDSESDEAEIKARRPPRPALPRPRRHQGYL